MMKWKTTLLAAAFAGATLFGASAALAETFAEWLDNHEVPAGQRGLQDNPAGDGIPNLAKYALNLDPMVASRDGLPEAEFVNDRLRLIVSKNPNAVGIGYEVVASTDLADWTSAGLDVISEDVNALVVEDTTDGLRRFLQLRISPPPAGPLPDAYLYVVGGRVPPASEADPDFHDTIENFDPVLDKVDTALFAITGTEPNRRFPEHRAVDVRSILIADVDVDGKTVSNWRRSGTYLPTHHPDSQGEDDGILHWTWMWSSVQQHNGRIYVGPAYHNLVTVELQSVSPNWAPTNFIAWADVDINTGELGEFTISDTFPANPFDQRAGATAIVEVDGVFYFYVIAGGSGPSTAISPVSARTDRVIYAPIDPNTGALGQWQVSSTPLPTIAASNAAIGVNGKLINTGGFSRGGTLATDHWRVVDIVTPDSGGDITATWQSHTFDEFLTSSSKTDHSVVRTEVDGKEFLHIVAGNDPIFYWAELQNGEPGFWDAWDMPDTRRAASAAAYKDMIVLTGGAPTFSYVTTLLENNLWIGTVGSSGFVTWTGNGGVPTAQGEPLWAPRSFHGSTIVPTGAAEE